MSASPKASPMSIDHPEQQRLSLGVAMDVVNESSSAAERNEENGDDEQKENEENEEEEEEEEEVAPRRSTRARKQVVRQAIPKLGSDSESSLSDAPVRRRRRRRKAPVATGETGEEGEAATGTPEANVPATPKRKRKRATAEEQEGEGAEEIAEVNGEKPAPKKRAAKKKKVEENGEEPAKDEEAEAGAESPPKRKRAPKKPKEEDGEGQEVVENGEGEDEAKPKKPRKSRAKEPIVYTIPDVVKKTTTFKGRLGYACLNTVLRAQRPSVFSSRTCRIDTIQKMGLDHVKELARQNVKDLLLMIEWNEKNNIRFMRMSSEMFPFASHGTYGYDLSFCQEELSAVGELAKKYGHRLTTHPGQFTQIASPKDNVVDQSIKELEYHAEMMDRMGLDQDSVMIIHMGGVYGDKATTLARFKDNFEKKLSDAIKRRLVLENDEICYTVDDLLKVCPQLGIPIVLDYHHHSINPSRRPIEELLPLINQTWQSRGIKPKQHLSQPRPGAVTAMELRAHSDRCDELPPELPEDMDLMIEAKDKEQAVFELYRIYGLQDVIWENLRPPAEDIGMRTKGRKSTGTGKKMRQAQQEGVQVAETEEQTLDPEMIDELADDDDI